MVTLHHSIVAGNFTGTGTTAADVSGTVAPASSFNLIGVDTGLGGISDRTQGNRVGTAASPLDPRLGPLADNGGPTLTHALLPASPAIDAGINSQAPAGLSIDQRGVPFARIAHGPVDLMPSWCIPQPRRRRRGRRRGRGGSGGGGATWAAGAGAGHGRHAPVSRLTPPPTGPR